MTTNGSVGEAITAALIRAEQLRQASPRHPRVLIATVSGDDNWASLSRRGSRSRSLIRAGELVALVEEAVKTAPTPPQRPSEVAACLDEEVFDCFTGACAKALTEEATAPLKTPIAATLPLGVAGEAVMTVALPLAALAAYSARITPEDSINDLRDATFAPRGAGEGAGYLMRARFDS